MIVGSEDVVICEISHLHFGISSCTLFGEVIDGIDVEEENFMLLVLVHCSWVVEML